MLTGEAVMRLLRPADIPGTMRLKEAAGWNQTERDWEAVLAAEPEGCFSIECDGSVAATATVVCYGRDLAWIGMVLTAPEFRRRGFARRLMERAIEYGVARGVGWIKLDATEMGAPLYRDLGFVDEQPIERWERLPAPAGEALVAPPAGFTRDLDREAFGADRSSVLERVAVESMSLEDCGFAMGRPGSKAFYFGPCVSRTADAAALLIKSFLARRESEPVYWDLLPRNEDAVRLARECGFVRRRELIRMSRPGAPGAAALRNRDDFVYAIAGFEYG